MESLLYAVGEVRNDLRLEFQNRPETKDLYIEVQKVSKHYSADTSILTTIGITTAIPPTSLLDRC